jgi:small subunit ribosomal protein S6
VREYETTVIIQPEISDEGVEEFCGRLDGIVEKGGGVRLMYDDQGRRRLAYEIQNFQKGRYVMLHFLDEGETIPTLERALRLEDSVLRFLTVQVDDAVTDIEARKAQAAEEVRIRAQRAAERAAREAEEAVVRAAREAEEEAGAALVAEAEDDADLGEEPSEAEGDVDLGEEPSEAEGDVDLGDELSEAEDDVDLGEVAELDADEEASEGEDDDDRTEKEA